METVNMSSDLDAMTQSGRADPETEATDDAADDYDKIPGDPDLWEKLK